MGWLIAHQLQWRVDYQAHWCQQPLQPRGKACSFLPCSPTSHFISGLPVLNSELPLKNKGACCLKQSCHHICKVALTYFKPFLYLTSNCQNRLYVTDLYQSLIFPKSCLPVPSCKDIKRR